MAAAVEMETEKKENQMGEKKKVNEKKKTRIGKQEMGEERKVR